MAQFIANRILAAAAESLGQGQAKYKVYFIDTLRYQPFRATVDQLLLNADQGQVILN